jgi:SAM-dependent methyltransferase
MADPADMREFWDERARENALYFVDNTLDYRSPDAERFWREGELVVERILQMLGASVEPGDHVVEIGCGVGRLTRALAALAARVTALDVSAEMLARARELNPELDGVTWLEGDGASLAGVDDASADACLSHVVFQHIPDPGVTLGYVREMGRVLRPGGWSAFQVSNDPGVHRPRRRLRALLRRGPRGQEHPAWLGSAVDLDELGATAAAAGMDVERVEGAGTQFCLVLLRRRAA